MIQAEEAKKKLSVERNATFLQSSVFLSFSFTSQRCWQRLSQWPVAICLYAICQRAGPFPPFQRSHLPFYSCLSASFRWEHIVMDQEPGFHYMLLQSVNAIQKGGGHYQMVQYQSDESMQQKFNGVIDRGLKQTRVPSHIHMNLKCIHK